MHGFMYRATSANVEYSATHAITLDAWKTYRADWLVLPKQWKSWCADGKLFIQNRSPRKYGGSSNRENWTILRGHGHMWRVTDDKMLQMGDSYEEFDRWALCNIEEVPLPKTLAEFREAVKTLIARKKEFYENPEDDDDA